MTNVTLSLWLPISRANFFSPSSGEWLARRDADGEVLCRSVRMDDPDYAQTPLLLVDVLRRVIEVMPESFGYDKEGVVEFRGDSATRQRPVSVALVLDLTRGGLASESQRRANTALSRAGIAQVRAVVNENGYYTFTATCDDSRDLGMVQAALVTHIEEVFGGDYEVHPTPKERKDNQGSASLKVYNGLKETKLPNGEFGDQRVGPPRGILNFYQLHVMAEGIWNDLLLPAMYLEQHDFIDEYQSRRTKESPEFHRGMRGVIGSIVTDVDATEPLGQISVLHHFLTITAQTSLRKLSMALESVRRRLLDEMMGALHRQNRLVQLNFSTNSRERIPELAVGATESQLKGYSTLVAAKIPLITGVREVVRLAKENLDWLVQKGVENETWSEREAEELVFQLSRLSGQLLHWSFLLDDLDKNVRSLELTIERAWMDQLLYEQQQTRSDQEAMAEIERSRQSRPTTTTPGRSAYNLVMLLLAAAAVVFTVTSANLDDLRQPGTGWWQVVQALWPIWGVATIAFGVIPIAGHLRRASREKRGLLLSYPYEFAFRLDENVDPNKLKAYADNRKRRRLKADPVGSVTISNRGYGRIEQMSPDSTLVKVHSVGAFKVRATRYAHFEIISEILVHRIASRDQHILVQCRIFGESPRPLSTSEVKALLATILNDLGTKIATDGDINVDDMVYRSLP